MLSADPPVSLLRAIYATITDKYYGLASLGLASLRERGTLRSRLLAALPPIEGVASSDEEKLALVRLWLAQWGRARGIWLPSMPGDWWNTKGNVKPRSGKFKLITQWLPPGAARRAFDQQWLPVLLHHFLRAPGKPVPASRRHSRAGDRRPVGVLRAVPAYPAALPRDQQVHQLRRQPGPHPGSR